MTEVEFQVCTEPSQRWRAYEGKVSDRKQRLFVCACTRVWHRRLSTLVKAALDTAERVADGRADWEELDTAESRFNEAYNYRNRARRRRPAIFARAALHPQPPKGTGIVDVY